MTLLPSGDHFCYDIALVRLTLRLKPAIWVMVLLFDASYVSLPKEETAHQDDTFVSSTPAQPLPTVPTTPTMRLLHTISAAALAFSSAAYAASAWTFDDATLQVNSKGAEPAKQKYANGM